MTWGLGVGSGVLSHQPLHGQAVRAWPESFGQVFSECPAEADGKAMCWVPEGERGCGGGRPEIVDFGGLGGPGAPWIPINRPGPPRTSICTKNQPRIPTLRPFRDHILSAKKIIGVLVLAYVNQELFQVCQYGFPFSPQQRMQWGSR